MRSGMVGPHRACAGSGREAGPGLLGASRRMIVYLTRSGSRCQGVLRAGWAIAFDRKPRGGVPVLQWPHECLPIEPKRLTRRKNGGRRGPRRRAMALRAKRCLFLSPWRSVVLHRPPCCKACGAAGTDPPPAAVIFRNKTFAGGRLAPAISAPGQVTRPSP